MRLHLLPVAGGTRGLIFKLTSPVMNVISTTEDKIFIKHSLLPLFLLCWKATGSVLSLSLCESSYISIQGNVRAMQCSTV